MGSRKKLVLDPRDPFLHKWSRILAISCFLAACLDPLFLYAPLVDGAQKCLNVDAQFLISACLVRTFFDIFYALHIISQFFTGFAAPSGQLVLSDELVDDHRAIAKRYLCSSFFVDIVAILPLPQVIVLVIAPMVDSPASLITSNLLGYVVFIQYVARLLRILPLVERVKTSAQTCWSGAAYCLFFYLLASHTIGAFWYFFSINRQVSCWRATCAGFDCDVSHWYCDQRKQESISLKDVAFLNASCPSGPDLTKESTVFDFGIYLDALQSQVVESNSFVTKLFYCIWWGLRAISSMGQNLNTSTHGLEILFAAIISIYGLVFVSSLIGIMMQKYLHTTSVREDEMRAKRRDAEQWMSYRFLPDSLRERIRRYQQLKWQETRGVEEDNLIRGLPKDLRRDIKRHLCLDLLMRVPLFMKMNEELLDTICDRLKHVLYTKKSFILREGDPVDEMLFIVRGNVVSVSTYGGRSGFFSSVYLKTGDFCGEDLLSWCFDPYSTNLPRSRRTVEATSEVEAFAFAVDDLKFVFSQFPLVHNKELLLSFRCSSLEWKTWAACSIQAAWRHRRERKLHECLIEAEHGAGLRNIVLQYRLSSQPRPQKPADPHCFIVDVAIASTSNGRSTNKDSKRMMGTIDVVLEELNSLKLGMEAIRVALNRTRGNEKLRSYTEERLYEEIEKVEGMGEETQMKVYQALSQDPSVAQAFLACPVKRRQLWLRVKFGSS